MDAVVPVAICICQNASYKNNEVSFIDLTQIISVQNSKEVLNSIKFEILSQNYWAITRNNSFTKVIQQLTQNIVELDSILKFKDAGINYQRVKVGLSQKASRILVQDYYMREKKSQETMWSFGKVWISTVSLFLNTHQDFVELTSHYEKESV